SESEAPADELVETDPANRHVAARIARAEVEPLFAGERLDDLGLDEGEAVPGAADRRPVAEPRRIAVALDPGAGNDDDAVAGLHRGSGAGCDVDRLDAAHPARPVAHATAPAMRPAARTR